MIDPFQIFLDDIDRVGDLRQFCSAAKVCSEVTSEPCLAL
jgi:hypothetical protein